MRRVQRSHPGASRRECGAPQRRPTPSPQTALRALQAAAAAATTTTTYLSSPPCSWARGHSCLGLRTGVSPHFSTNSMRAMVAAQCQCVIGSERVRCSGDAAERPAGPLRPPAGCWRAPRPPPYSRAMPCCRTLAAVASPTPARRPAPRSAYCAQSVTGAASRCGRISRRLRHARRAAGHSRNAHSPRPAQPRCRRPPAPSARSRPRDSITTRIRLSLTNIMTITCKSSIYVRICIVGRPPVAGGVRVRVLT